MTNIINAEATLKKQDTWKESSHYDQWEKLDYLSGSDDPYVKIVTALMLENQRLHDELAADCAVDKARELVSKIVPNLLAHKIVSVQPKLGPNSIVYFTKFAYENGQVKVSVENEDMVSRTRKLKAYQDTVESVDTLAMDIIDEINNEILTDLYNNVGTVATLTDDADDWESLHGKICTVSGYIHRKTLRQRKYWMVVSPATHDKYMRTFESFKYGNYKVHVVNTFRDDCILMGQKGDSFFDSDYIWSPYIMLAKTPEFNDPDFVPRRGFIIRYGKKLTRNGAKSYARIMLPKESIDFSTFNVKASMK